VRSQAGVRAALPAALGGAWPAGAACEPVAGSVRVAIGSGIGLWRARGLPTHSCEQPRAPPKLNWQLLCEVKQQAAAEQRSACAPQRA